MNESGKNTVRTIGFGRRLLAALWDGLIVFVMSFLLLMLMGLIMIWHDSFNPNESVPFVELMFFTGILLSLFYYVGFWSTSGQTLGKATLGIKVVGENGKPLSIGRAILRWIGFIISAIVFSIGFIWIEIDPQRRGWHDLIAGSRVISEDDFPADAGKVEWVPGNKDTGWVWIVVWILVAISPIGLSALSLFVLSPYVNDFVTALLGL